MPRLVRAELRTHGEDGLAGRAYVSALPFAMGTETRAFPELERARNEGIRIALVLPIDDGNKVRAVVLMFT